MTRLQGAWKETVRGLGRAERIWGAGQGSLQGRRGEERVGRGAQTRKWEGTGPAGWQVRLSSLQDPAGAPRERPGRAQRTWEAGAALLEAALLSLSCRRGLSFSSEGARGPAEQSGGRGRSLGPQAEPLVRCVGGEGRGRGDQRRQRKTTAILGKA